MAKMQIPTEADWEGAENADDLDLPYAYKLFSGKSNSEMQDAFKRNPLERSFELESMPIKPFQYYIMGFRDFLLAGEFEFLTSSDAASTYLLLIKRKLQNDPEFILPIFPELKESINFVAENQTKFEAPEDIYGSFPEIRNQIMELYDAAI